MKATLHENGWTVILTDFDFKTATKEEMDLIGCWLATNTLVIARNQSMTVDEEVEVVKKFGEVEYAVAEQPGATEEQIQRNKEIIERYEVPGSNGYLLRVSGEENHKGEKGLFGAVHELDWHANQVERKDRKPLVWLRSIRGSVGSKTSWTNHAVAYQSLPLAMKKLCQRLKVNYTYHYNKWDGNTDVDMLANVLRVNKGLPDYYPPLVMTNNAGLTGLFFSWNQVQSFEGISESETLKIISTLRDLILADERNLYHHDWQDGDVAIAEQWLGIHKRWPFDGLGKRVLHRATFDFANIDLAKIPQAQELLKNNT